MENRIESRRKDYKKVFDDPLRRRENEQIQIRKTAREQHLAKKRIQTTDPSDETLVDEPGIQELPLNIISDMMSDDPVLQFEAAQLTRKLLSVELMPPIQLVIGAGLVPRLTELLQRDDRPPLQLECAWALTNVASGTSQQTHAVVNSGAVPVCVRLLDSPREDVKEQAVWALGNIAGDSPEMRNLVINAGALGPLLRELKRADDPSARISLIRYATWTVSNFCRGKPETPFEVLKQILPVWRGILYSNDVEVLTDACWALAYMSDAGEGLTVAIIDEIIRAGICGKLVDLLSHKVFTVQTPALRAVGNIVTGDDRQTQTMIGFGCLPKLKALLDNPRNNIKKEACWALSNITAGNQEQIGEVIALGIIPDLAHVLANSDFMVKREVVWCLANAASGGSAQQVMALVDAKVITPLVNVLDVHDHKIIAIALEAIDNILKTGATKQQEEGLPENPYVQLLEEANAFPKIEKLQFMTAGSRVHQLAVKIMTTHLDVDVDGFHQPSAPMGSFGGMA